MAPKKIVVLQRKREQIFGQLAVIGTFVEMPEFVTCSVQAVEIRLAQVDRLVDRLEGLMDDFYAIDNVDVEQEKLVAFDFDQKTAVVEEKLRRRLADLKPDRTAPPPQQDEKKPIAQGIAHQFRMPRIELPKFAGGYDAWFEFKPRWESLIANSNLDETLKLSTLLQCMTEKSEAEQLIRGVQVAPGNFAVAWQLLVDEWEIPHRAVEINVNALFDISPEKHDDAASLRHLKGEFSRRFLSLKALGEPVEQWDSLLVGLIKRRLDTHTLREVEKDAPSDRALTVQELLAALTKRVRVVSTVPIGENVSLHDEIGGTRKKTSDVKVSPRVACKAATDGACDVCGGAHAVVNCPEFRCLLIGDRYARVRELGLCFTCLGVGHASRNCSVKAKCPICDRRHHSLLHYDRQELPRPPHQPPPALQAPQDCNVAARGRLSPVAPSFAPRIVGDVPRPTQVVLPTVVVVVRDRHGNAHFARALLDSGSQPHFVTTSLVERLQLQRRRIDMPVNGVGCAATNVSHVVTLTIESRVCDCAFTLDFLVMREITSDLPNYSLDVPEIKILKGVELSDPQFYLKRPIDMLIGAEVYHEILGANTMRVCSELPPFRDTLFGWVFAGRVNGGRPEGAVSGVAQVSLVSNADLREALERLWREQEVAGPEVMQTEEERECEEHFRRTFRRQEDGRYVVQLPFRSDPRRLGDSKMNAERQFLALERRLSNRPEWEKYVRFMDEYAELGHMEPVGESDEARSPTYYIPHHAVTVSKFRVVFNASKKTATGYSLNDLLRVGPAIQDDIVSLVIRFREHRFGLKGDLAKMYRQVLVAPEQRDLQRIIWRRNRSEQLTSYRLRTVTYGTSSASFLATRVLKQLAIDEAADYPEECQILAEDFYVDDLATGDNTEEGAVRRIHRLRALLGRGQFDLRKLASNSAAVLQSVPAELHEGETVIGGDNGNRVLGIVWRTGADVLQLKPVTYRFTGPVTKRAVMSALASIYDPLGYAAPVTFRAKCFVQRLARDKKLDFDTELEEQDQKSWLSFWNQIDWLSEIRIPRWLVGLASPDGIQIHAFGDASERGYGAVAYLRSSNGAGQVVVRLIVAKSRVAPSPAQTIPRLELCAAVLAAQLVDKILRTTRLCLDSVHYYTDSMVVQAWINSEPALHHTYVANRIAKVQALSEPRQWHHMPGRLNPADLASRGLDPAELIENEFWFEGPAFLKLDEKEWPIAAVADVDLGQLEMKPAVAMQAAATPSRPHPIIDRFSDHNRMIRIAALCLRVAENHRCRKQNRPKVIGPLAVSELELARAALIRIVQRTHYPSEIAALEGGGAVPARSSLRCLNPFIDEGGILRVGGRLRYAQVSPDAKHPTVLPRQSSFTRTLVRYEHRDGLHAPAQALVAKVRQRYWIPGLRSLARQVTRECIPCFRVRPRLAGQLMGELPLERVQPAYPFVNCGVDLCGPFDVRPFVRSKASLKMYLAIFVCFATKAVHIEPVPDLTAESMVATLHRFASRRGRPANIYSDNATNFTGARAILQRNGNIDISVPGHIGVLKLSSTSGEMVAAEIIDRACSSKGMQWHFIPANSPHFGGLWEAAVGRTKYHLKRVIEEFAPHSKLTYAELETLAVQVEGVLNSRPLGELTDDPNDLAVLTPGHFLVGRPLNSIIGPNLLESKMNRLARWETVQRLTQEFWRRWSKEYLVTLQERRKWQRQRPNLEVGDLVLIADDNLRPQDWNLGRVEKVFPGDDGQVRAAQVKTEGGVFRRAVARLAKLPVESSGSEAAGM